MAGSSPAMTVEGGSALGNVGRTYTVERAACKLPVAARNPASFAGKGRG